MRREGSFFLKQDIWAWLIIGLTVLIYGHSLSNGFIWDDRSYLPSIGSTGDLKEFLGIWAFSNPLSGFPLTVSILWLEHRSWGFHPWGYHVFCLTLHVLNALLLLGLVRRIVPSLAVVTALLFAIHPIQVESVAWIAEQKNLLCFFFMILAFHSFLDFDASRKNKDYAKTLLFFTAALLCKCIAICFAVVPLLYVWWRNGSVSAGDLRRSLPLFFVGLFTIIRPMINENIGSSHELSTMFFGEKAILAGKNFFFYIKQIILPWKFLTAYPPWEIQMTRWENWIFPAGVIFLYLVLYRFRDRLGRGAFALFCFYGVSIFPALGFFNVSLLSMTPASDHFSYLSVPPILLLFSAAMQSLGGRIVNHPVLSALKPSPFLMNAIMVAGIFYLSATSFCLTLSYKDQASLWRRLFLERPDSFIGNIRYGTVCVNEPSQCDEDQAIVLLQRALSLRPHDRSAQKTLGIAYEKKGLFQAAIDLYLQASMDRDPFIQAHYYRRIGSIFLEQGDFPKAVFFLEKEMALQSRADYVKFRNRHLRMQEGLDTGEGASFALCGKAYFLSGDFQKAAHVFRQAMVREPEKIENYVLLGESLMNLGDIPGALKAFEAACRLDPGNINAKSNRDRALAMSLSSKTKSDAS